MTIITFSGVDGSGKTTAAGYVAECLRREGKHVKVLHLTSWTLVYMVGGWLSSVAPPASGSQQTTFIRSRLARSLRRAISVLDLLRFRFTVLFHTRLRRRVLICDRYFYDLAVQAVYHNVMELDSTFYQLYWRLIPTTALSFLLDVTPPRAQRREGDHELDYYVEKRVLYRRLAARGQLNVIPMVDLEETKRRIDHLLDRHVLHLRKVS